MVRTIKEAFYRARVPHPSMRLRMVAVKHFFDWCDEHRLQLADIEAITVATYIEQLGTKTSKPTVNGT